MPTAMEICPEGPKVSKYYQYYNKTLIKVHYACAKELNKNELDERMKNKEGPGLKNIIFIIICSIIILENLLVLIAVFRNKKFHSAMFFFIGNLAFSDLLAGSAYIANIFFSGPKTFDLVPVQWFIREGTAFIALAASVFSLLAIAIERYIAITKVKVYGSNKTCRMFLLIGACWVTSILLGGLPIIGWNCINELTECSAVLPLNSRRYIRFVVSIFSVILLSIVILYVRIYLIVRSSHQEATNSQAYALLKTVTIVLGVFIVCWLPAFTILLLDTSCKMSSCPILSHADAFFGIATLNSALNPLIYTLRSKDMRREFLRVLCCWGLFQCGRPAERCMVPLKSSSSLDHCTNKHEHQTTPIMQDCTTGV
ncbi:sphingosine 1-phosphate receptor 2 [Electrophorus electricus]|uniref:G-protein coupled receptors family 1 profile domain-containing protein n=1 Tax=Electrophorus electricus TaxID=8005 RepID=A0A4W4GWC1_ELEEL|nr:sphingosine 1-phosphate receptor 2 [Electrophorus electricus]XP_026888444.2 sphingosine 1-phosphate receptor 2 [Electrophorus electricus]